MKEFKSIYDFTATKKVEKPVEEITKVKGKEVKTITNEVQDVPVKILFKKPSRREEEMAQLFYAKQVNHYARDESLMTKAMLLNKYRDSGGLMSEKTQKERADAYTKILKVQEEYVELKALSRPTKKKKQRMEELEKEFTELQNYVVDLEAAHNALLENTADAHAQNDLLRWYAMRFTYVQEEEDDDPVPYFVGEDYEEKLEDYYNKEESEDEFYEQIRKEIGTIVAVWLFKKTVDSEEFKKLVEQAKSFEWPILS